MSAHQIPPNDWATFTRHSWLAFKPSPDLSTWDTNARCEDVVELLRAHNCKSILDAASGYGLKTFRFNQMGFETLGANSAEICVRYGRELADASGIDIEFRHLSWAEIPGRFDGQFDAFYNDNFPNAQNRQELSEAAAAAFASLKQGGIALFGSRSAEEWQMTPEERVEKRWEGDSPRMWWNRKTPEGSLMTVQVPERFPRGIFKHFFHLTNGVDAEHSGWYDNLEWTLDDFREALEDVGFAHIELIELPSGDLEGVATK